MIYKIRKEFEILGVEVDLVSKSYNDLFKSAFLARESYLSEGYSLMQIKFIAEGFGYKPMVLFRYDIKSLTKSQRMRFFSERIIVSPVYESENVKDYFKSWSIKYPEIPILMPLRIIESEVFRGK